MPEGGDTDAVLQRRADQCNKGDRSSDISQKGSRNAAEYMGMYFALDFYEFNVIIYIELVITNL